MTPTEIADRLSLHGTAVAMPDEMKAALAAAHGLDLAVVHEIVWQAEAYVADKEYAQDCRLRELLADPATVIAKAVVGSFWRMEGGDGPPGEPSAGDLQIAHDVAESIRQELGRS